MLESVFAELLPPISEYFASVSCNNDALLSLAFEGFRQVQNTGLKECDFSRTNTLLPLSLVTFCRFVFSWFSWIPLVIFLFFC